MAILDEIYQAMDDEDGYARLPEMLARAVGARSAILIDLDERMQSQSWVRHAVPDEVIGRYAALDLWQHDLWSHLMARQGYRNRAVNSDEVIEVERFRESLFFNELYRPLDDDTARCLGIVLDRPGGSIAMGLHRAYGQPAYQARDVARLQSLVPHLRRIVAVRDRLQRAEGRAALLHEALDRFACGVLLLDAFGRLLFANHAGEALLRSRTGLTLRSGCVAPRHAGEADQFDLLVRTAATMTGDRGGAMRLTTESGSVQALVMPFSTMGSGALILLEAEQSRQDFAHILAGLYRLTAAEAAIANLLGQGFTPREIAERRRVGMSTVRSQIQALLHKTDAKGLGDLQRTLGQIFRFGGSLRTGPG